MHINLFFRVASKYQRHQTNTKCSWCALRNCTQRECSATNISTTSAFMQANVTSSMEITTGQRLALRIERGPTEDTETRK